MNCIKHGGPKDKRQKNSKACTICAVEKHEEYLESFGKELEAQEDVSMVCGECYCELVGKTPPKHTYAQVLH